MSLEGVQIGAMYFDMNGFCNVGVEFNFRGSSQLVLSLLHAQIKHFLRDTGFSDLVHHPDSKLLKTQRFGNWICFRPQLREDTYAVGSLRKSYPQSSPEDGNRSSFQNAVFLVISNPDDGQSQKTQILCVLYTIVRTL
jgi:hypothetical protein